MSGPRSRAAAAQRTGTAVADTVQRIAVLLRAGIVPERAWGYVGQVDGGEAERIAERIKQGHTAADAIAAQGEHWDAVAAAWRIAQSTGAPLADALMAIATAVRDGAESARDVQVALAEPIMTARVMLLLPLIGLLLGAALGFDTIGVLTTNPIAIGCVIAGGLLVLGASRWTARMVRRARQGEAAPGLRAELTAVALTGGVSMQRAELLVDDSEVRGGEREVERVLELSRLAGVPAADLLRAEAVEARSRARTDARMRAAKLGSSLLLPLGVCTLPAFFLLGVAPMVLSVITTTQIG